MAGEEGRGTRGWKEGVGSSLEGKYGGLLRLDELVVLGRERVGPASEEALTAVAGPRHDEAGDVEERGL